MLLRALSALVASFGRLIRMDNKVGSRREEHLQCAQTVFGKFEITVTFHIKCQPEFDSAIKLRSSIETDHRKRRTVYEHPYYYQ